MEWAERTEARDVMSRGRSVMLGIAERSAMLVTLRVVAKTWWSCAANSLASE